MRNVWRLRRMVAVLIFLGMVLTLVLTHPSVYESRSAASAGDTKTTTILNSLAVKGRAPKTGYSRAQFGDGWGMIAGCDVRNVILFRDLKNAIASPECKVLSGTLNDPYTGTIIMFKRGFDTSDDVQIDHVVALSNAWQTGAQQLPFVKREAFANDPLNLLAVDGDANQQKADGDAATWLPPNKPFRCQYVTRQVEVKRKYSLWVTPAEKVAIQRVLEYCN